MTLEQVAEMLRFISVAITEKLQRAGKTDLQVLRQAVGKLNTARHRDLWWVIVPQLRPDRYHVMGFEQLGDDMGAPLATMTDEQAIETADQLIQ